MGAVWDLNRICLSPSARIARALLPVVFLLFAVSSTAGANEQWGGIEIGANGITRTIVVVDDGGKLRLRDEVSEELTLGAETAFEQDSKTTKRRFKEDAIADTVNIVERFVTALDAAKVSRDHVVIAISRKLADSANCFGSA